MSNFYGVIDPARDPRLFDWVMGEAQQTCLFMGKLDPRVTVRAPHLVWLNDDSRLLKNWRDNWGRSWGIQCRSTRSFEDVRRHFRRLQEAKLPDGEIIFFRYYDPRVLRVYLPSCNAAELSQWFDAVDEYLLESADGTAVLHYTLRDGSLKSVLAGVN